MRPFFREIPAACGFALKCQAAGSNFAYLQAQAAKWQVTTAELPAAGGEPGRPRSCRPLRGHRGPCRRPGRGHRRPAGPPRTDPALRQESRDHSGEHVAAAGRGHAGVAGGIDKDAPAIGHNRALPLENKHDVVVDGKARRQFPGAGFELWLCPAPSRRENSPGWGVMTSGPACPRRPSVCRALRPSASRTIGPGTGSGPRRPGR